MILGSAPSALRFPLVLRDGGFPHVRAAWGPRMEAGGQQACLWETPGTLQTRARLRFKNSDAGALPTFPEHPAGVLAFGAEQKETKPKVPCCTCCTKVPMETDLSTGSLTLAALGSSQPPGGRASWSAAQEC